MKPGDRVCVQKLSNNIPYWVRGYLIWDEKTPIYHSQKKKNPNYLVSKRGYILVLSDRAYAPTNYLPEEIKLEKDCPNCISLPEYFQQRAIDTLKQLEKKNQTLP